MRDYTDFTELIERIINKYTKTQNNKSEYGSGTAITKAEIHTIDIIGLNPDINITQIAKIQGITKGAVSQMIYKLRDKGLVIKAVSSNSDAEVCINLTDKGLIAYNNHKIIHQKVNKIFYDKLDNFSSKEYEGFVDLLTEFENFLDKDNKSKK